MKNWRKVKQAANGELYIPESNLQIACVRLFAVVYSKYFDFLFSIPNEGKRSKTTSSRMKAEGMKSGVADLMFAFPAHGFHGLFIEMKTIVGSLSPDQRKFCELMAGVGFAVCVPKTLAEFEKGVDDYLKNKFVQYPVWEKAKRNKKTT